MNVLAEVWWWVAAGGIAIAALLFVAKVVWNFGVPYVLIRRRRTGRTGGISTHPFVELALLAVALLLAVLSGQDGWLRPTRLALVGVALLAASYLHMVVAPVLFRPTGSSGP